jgi:AcrR family transcriptional regulator
MRRSESVEVGAGSAGARHHGNRHGRSEPARRAVLSAADDLLVERGFAGVTMEGIAARAGVSKQTIYRWWRSKTEVLIDTYLDDAAQHLTPPDHGDLDRDLRAYLRRLARFLTKADSGAVFRALVGQAQHDADIAEAVRARCLDEQRARDRLPLERAVARGELAAELDLDIAVDELVGPLYYRVLVTGAPVGASFVDTLVDDFLARGRPARESSALGRSEAESLGHGVQDEGRRAEHTGTVAERAGDDAQRLVL